jgi:alanine dehydrogenase
MIIGCPKELKNHEYRVGLTPAGVQALVAAGHTVIVEKDAGFRVGFDDAAYRAAGARLVSSAAKAYQAELVVKIKELQPAEFDMLGPGQILFGYQHLAPDPNLVHTLLERQLSCIAYETVTDGHGGLPLLAPMSEVAGRMAVQAGAAHLEKSKGGMGLLLGGVPGVPPAHVMILGAGVVGTNAMQMAAGLGARVSVFDRNIDRLRHLDLIYGNRIETVYSTAHAIEEHIVQADLVIGGVLIPGAAAPKLVTRAMVSRMKPGAVIVDVAIDQGGCFETAHATTHADPTYVVDGVIHYCVANMPGAAARTATLALTQVTLPHVLALAEKGLRGALATDPGLAAGLQIHAGQITHAALAEELCQPTGPMP